MASRARRPRTNGKTTKAGPLEWRQSTEVPVSSEERVLLPIWLDLSKVYPDDREVLRDVPSGMDLGRVVPAFTMLSKVTKNGHTALYVKYWLHSGERERTRIHQWVLASATSEREFDPENRDAPEADWW